MDTSLSFLSSPVFQYGWKFVAGFILAIILLNIMRGALVYIPNTQYGIMERKWAIKPSKEEFGLIALKMNAGFVPEVLRGGWHFLTPFMYRVHRRDLIRIDQIAYLVARVGAPLQEGQALGAWPSGVEVDDARGFLTRGGQRGSQRQILRSGTYAINTALFCVITADEILNIDGYASADDKALQTLIEKRNGFDPIVITDDNLGIITVQDGPSLTHGEIIAPTVGEDVSKPDLFHNSFQDIAKFLAAGGRRGKQEQVIVEGTYYVNRLFCTVEVMKKTKIGIGTVGVVCSFVGAEVMESITAEQGRGKVVKKGERGIWERPLEPGKYAINTYGAEITVVPTTNFKLQWEEGTTSALSDARSAENRVSYDDNLREILVITKDAFQMLIPISVVAHISPMNAPFVIQRFSQVSRLVNQTLDPLVSSYFRDSAQSMNLLDFNEQRVEIGKSALATIKARMAEHKIDIEEVLIGPIRDVQGSTSIATLLEQIRQRQMSAQQLLTFTAQGEAADAQKDLNERKARADQQETLTASKIMIDIAENEGRATSARNKQTGDGIRALADAEAYATEKKGFAEASASKATAEAVGGTENLMTQFAMTKLADAIIKSQNKLVPDTLIAAGDGKSGSLLDTLMALAVKDRVTPGSTEKRATLLG